MITWRGLCTRCNLERFLTHCNHLWCSETSWTVCSSENRT